MDRNTLASVCEKTYRRFPIVAEQETKSYSSGKRPVLIDFFQFRENPLMERPFSRRSVLWQLQMAELLSLP